MGGTNALLIAQSLLPGFIGTAGSKSNSNSKHSSGRYSADGTNVSIAPFGISAETGTDATDTRTQAVWYRFSVEHMVGRVPETPSSSFEVADAAVGGGVRNRAGLTVVSMVAGRQEELLSMNLGLGASLVLLLSGSDMELRAQEEALVFESRQVPWWKEEKQANHHCAAAPAASSTTRESDSGGSATTTAMKDPISSLVANADASSNCSHTVADTAVEGHEGGVMDLMEVEQGTHATLGWMRLDDMSSAVKERVETPLARCAASRRTRRRGRRGGEGDEDGEGGPAAGGSERRG